MYNKICTVIYKGPETEHKKPIELYLGTLESFTEEIMLDLKLNNKQELCQKDNSGEKCGVEATV